MEALFGAVYLDAGFAAAEEVVLGLFVPYLAKVDVLTLGKDAKTLLQEYLQGKHIPLPAYTVTATQGEAHAQSFQVECAIPSLGITARGEGSSRRNAEQQAAQAAYQQLTNIAAEQDVTSTHNADSRPNHFAAASPSSGPAGRSRC
jgi:ribonuclease-3